MCVQNFLSPGELDPLNRRQIREDKPDVVVQGMEGFIYCRKHSILLLHESKGSASLVYGEWDIGKFKKSLVYDEQDMGKLVMFRL